jgi:hypothetical protein
MEKAIMILILEIGLKVGDYSIQIMVEIGIVEIIGMGTPLVNWYNVRSSVLLEEASTGVHCGYRNKGSQ